MSYQILLKGWAMSTEYQKEAETIKAALAESDMALIINIKSLSVKQRTALVKAANRMVKEIARINRMDLYERARERLSKNAY